MIISRRTSLRRKDMVSRWTCHASAALVALTASLGVASLTAARAEPLVLTDEQLDEVSAGGSLLWVERWMDRETAHLHGDKFTDKIEDVIEKFGKHFDLSKFESRLKDIIEKVVKKHGGKTIVSKGEVVVIIDGKKEQFQLKPGQPFKKAFKSDGTTVNISISGSGSSNSSVFISSGSSTGSSSVIINNQSGSFKGSNVIVNGKHL